MLTTGWVKVSENDDGDLKLSFFETEHQAQMASLRDSGFALADNVKQFSFGLDQDDGLVMDIT